MSAHKPIAAHVVYPLYNILFNFSTIVFVSLWRYVFESFIIINVAKKYAHDMCGTIADPTLLKISTNKAKIQILKNFYFSNLFQLEIHLKLQSFQNPKQLNIRRKSTFLISSPEKKIRPNNSLVQKAYKLLAFHGPAKDAINAGAEKEIFLHDLQILSHDLKFSMTDILQYFWYLHQKEKYIHYQMKLTEEAWKAVTMSFITIYGFYFVLNSDFFYDPSKVLHYWPNKISPKLLFYYQMEFGYHGHRALHQIFDSRMRKKDLLAMIIHHWVTFGLIIYSWMYGYMEFGALVMFAHDNSDVWLSLAKLLKYRGMIVTSNFVFIVFCISWIFFRIFLFAQKCILPLMIFTWKEKFDWEHKEYGVAIAFLCVLFALHVHWSRMIIAASCKAIKKQQSIESGMSGSDTESITDVITNENLVYDKGK